MRKRLTLVSRDASLVSDEEVIQEMIDLDYRSYLRDDPAYIPQHHRTDWGDSIGNHRWISNPVLRSR